MVELDNIEIDDYSKSDFKLDIIGASSDKVELKVPNALELLVQLHQWEKMGLMLHISLRERVTYENIVQWSHNEKPYSNREEALDEYEKVGNAVKSGKYKIEYTLNRKPKLVILE